MVRVHMNVSEQKIFPYESVDLTKTYPEWNSPLLSADYVYIRTFEEVDRVKTKLTEKETEAEFFNTEMKMKWEKLKKRQMDFLADVRKYDQFFCENEQKLKRISGKIASELVKQANYEEEIGMFEERDTYLSDKLQKMENSVNIISPYNNFLAKLIGKEEKDDTENINTFVNTFVLLTSERKLHDEFAHTLLETEMLHSQMQAYVTAQQTTFLKKTSDLFCARKQLNSEKEELLTWRNKLNRRKEELQNETEESISMKWSYDNVYQLLRKWKRIPSTSRMENNDQKTLFIGNTVDELRCVVKQAQELNDECNLSCKADSSFMTLKRMI